MARLRVACSKLSKPLLSNALTTTRPAAGFGSGIWDRNRLGTRTHGHCFDKRWNGVSSRTLLEHQVWDHSTCKTAPDSLEDPAAHTGRFPPFVIPYYT